MRVKKVMSVYMQQLEIDFPLFTEPNQSFTPRQIIDQFSRGELSAKSFDSSDDIDDSNYSDDVMVDHIIDFEDEFTALEFMMTTKVKKNSKKDDNRFEEHAKESTDSVSEGSNQQET